MMMIECVNIMKRKKHIVKKDNEYKELKTPEEMTKTERKKNSISDYVEEGSNGTF